MAHLSMTDLEVSSSNQQRVSSVKALLHLLRDAFASVCGGCLAGFLSFFLLPCNWFGSSFEGACGYGVLWAAMGVGVVVAGLSFLWLGVRSIRTLYASVLAQVAHLQHSAPLARAWLMLLVIYWVQLLLVASWPGATAGLMVTVMWLSFLAFAVVSALLLRRIQLPALLSLLLLIPFVGMVLLPCAIFREAVSLATASSTETQA